MSSDPRDDVEDWRKDVDDPRSSSSSSSSSSSNDDSGDWYDPLQNIGRYRNQKNRIRMREYDTEFYGTRWMIATQDGYFLTMAGYWTNDQNDPDILWANTQEAAADLFEASPNAVKQMRGRNPTVGEYAWNGWRPEEDDE